MLPEGPTAFAQSFVNLVFWCNVPRILTFVSLFDVSDSLPSLQLLTVHGHISNVTFSSDLLQNPLIVPLKRLSHHRNTDDFGVFDVVFHPSQPWLFSSGADGTVNLYT